VTAERGCEGSDEFTNVSRRDKWVRGGGGGTGRVRVTVYTGEEEWEGEREGRKVIKDSRG